MTPPALVVVNYADRPAAAAFHLPWADLADDTWRLDDLLSQQVFERDGSDMARAGLYVQLPAWGHHLLSWTRTDALGPT